MRGGAPVAHDSLVAKSKMMLILSLEWLDAKRENRLRHQYPSILLTVRRYLTQEYSILGLSSSRTGDLD